MTGAALRRLRNALGLTQRELARRLGVDPQTVSNWERGEYRIPPMVTLALKALRKNGTKGGAKRKR